MNFNLIWAFENLNCQVGVGDFQHTPNQACHTQKQKVGFRHFVTFGTTFRVRVGHFSIPPTMNIIPKNKKLGFRHFATFLTTFRVRVGHFSIPPTMKIIPKNKKLELGILQYLEQLLGLGWGISAYPLP